MRFVYALVAWAIVGIAALAVVGYSGAYPVGADVPHWPATMHLIEWVRDRSVDRRTADLAIPSLRDPAMIKLGAQTYAEHCSECHLAPGLASTPLHEHLYPRPPALPTFHPSPGYSFWAIKHGFKMTAMPAWGSELDDHTIWSLVAFLQQQPGMGAAEYRALSVPAPAATAPAGGAR